MASRSSPISPKPWRVVSACCPRRSRRRTGSRSSIWWLGGRYPHQSLLRQWTPADEQAVQAALEATNTTELADRGIDELSGGQRQRVWLAMVLAQQAEIVRRKV